MTMPPSSFTVHDVVEYVGNRMIEVVDVLTQQSVLGWNLNRYPFFSIDLKTETVLKIFIL